MVYLNNIYFQKLNDRNTCKKVFDALPLQRVFHGIRLLRLIKDWLS